MAKHKVIVKHLSAIQNLGSVDILCSDKTGTLTQGTMAFESSCDAFGHAFDRPLFFARLNSKFETGIRSPLDTAILAQVETAEAGAYAKVDEIPFDLRGVACRLLLRGRENDPDFQGCAGRNPGLRHRLYVARRQGGDSHRRCARKVP